MIVIISAVKVREYARVLEYPGSVLASCDRHILEARERLPVPFITAAELIERLGRG
jgi:hypothetical protein